MSVTLVLEWSKEFVQNALSTKQKQAVCSVQAARTRFAIFAYQVIPKQQKVHASVTKEPLIIEEILNYNSDRI